MAVKAAVGLFTATLADLGLIVSTGRVVDFRAPHPSVTNQHRIPFRSFIRAISTAAFVHWPKSTGRKPNAIVANEEIESLLVPAANYVLTKRFTSKEERRRIVACIFDPSKLPPCDNVGFENHLNYFHASGRGCPWTWHADWQCFNSTLVDLYFRQFNGHTQSTPQICAICVTPPGRNSCNSGNRVKVVPVEQNQLDELVEEELNVRR